MCFDKTLIRKYGKIFFRLFFGELNERTNKTFNDTPIFNNYCWLWTIRGRDTRADKTEQERERIRLEQEQEREKKIQETLNGWKAVVETYDALKESGEYESLIEGSQMYITDDGKGLVFRESQYEMLGLITYSMFIGDLIPDYIQEFTNFPGNLWSESSGIGTPTGITSSWESDFWLNSAGNKSAKINLYFSNTHNWLLSPNFDLSGGTYQLNLNVGVTEWNVTTSSNMGSDDTVKLMISQDLGVNWTSLYSWTNSNNPGNLGQQLPTIDLSAYTGIVKFAFYASDGSTNDIEDYDFFVDDFG